MFDSSFALLRMGQLGTWASGGWGALWQAHRSYGPPRPRPQFQQTPGFSLWARRTSWPRPLERSFELVANNNGRPGSADPRCARITVWPQCTYTSDTCATHGTISVRKGVFWHRRDTFVRLHGKISCLLARSLLHVSRDPSRQYERAETATAARVEPCGVETTLLSHVSGGRARMAEYSP
jgi:hypothetical protein